MTRPQSFPGFRPPIILRAEFIIEARAMPSGVRQVQGNLPRIITLMQLLTLGLFLALARAFTPEIFGAERRSAPGGAFASSK